jgi:hypothetical protein
MIVRKGIVCGALLAGGCLVASPFLAAADFNYSNKFDNVVAEVWLPGDAPVVRGMIVHAANYKLKPDDRWAAFGRSVGFGHVALNMDNVRGAGNRGPRLRAALDKALKECAEQTGRKELLNVPFVGTGHSAGGLVTPTLLATPERVLTLTIDCGWVSDPKKFKPVDKSVPQLFTLGSIPDDFNMLPGIESNFVPARVESWPWALGLQHGCAHDFGNAATLQIPWMAGVIAARLPADADPRGGISRLRDVKLEDGWLGDIDFVSNHWATIAPWTEFRGDKSRAAWFPNRAVAFVWRAWEAMDAPVTLEAAASDGSAAWPAWSPKASRDLTVNLGVDVQLSLAVRDGALSPASVQFLAGDTVLGEAKSPPWRFTWSRPKSGVHAVHAIWSAADGSPGAVNPALLLVRATEKKP